MCIQVNYSKSYQHSHKPGDAVVFRASTLLAHRKRLIGKQAPDGSLQKPLALHVEQPLALSRVLDNRRVYKRLWWLHNRWQASLSGSFVLTGKHVKQIVSKR